MKIPWILIGGIVLLGVIFSLIGGYTSKASARIGETHAKQTKLLESATNPVSK